LTEEHAALARQVARYARDRAALATGAGFPMALWRGLADLGVFWLAAPGPDDGDDGAGAGAIVAVMEALGRETFPGPLVATFVAMQLCPAADRQRIGDGAALVSLGTPPLLPWAPVAGVFIEIVDEVDGHVWLARRHGAIEPCATLGGEPWGRAALDRVRDLGPASAALALGEIARAAYLAGAGRRLIDDAAEHARTRVQFGRPLGAFQAVAHPLAVCTLALDAARLTAGAAAAAWARALVVDEPPPVAAAAAARLSAVRAALAAAHTAAQSFGAMGMTEEGPVFPAARRIRQIASLPPGEAAAKARVLLAHGL
jgi:alkylation response protein AidB-like acyl-CoA dehydrogenase